MTKGGRAQKFLPLPVSKRSILSNRTVKIYNRAVKCSYRTIKYSIIMLSSEHLFSKIFVGAYPILSCKSTLYVYGDDTRLFVLNFFA